MTVDITPLELGVVPGASDNEEDNESGTEEAEEQAKALPKPGEPRVHKPAPEPPTLVSKKWGLRDKDTKKRKGNNFPTPVGYDIERLRFASRLLQKRHKRKCVGGREEEGGDSTGSRCRSLVCFF